MHYPIPLINLLEDTIANVIRVKKDIKKMFIQCGVACEVIEGHDWEPMRKAISPILEYLNNGRGTNLVLDKIIQNILAYTDGAHLLWMSDGNFRKTEAENALARLRKSINEHEKAKVSQEVNQATRELHQKKINEQKDYNRKLAGINHKFIDCTNNTDAQKRGYQFELVLHELFVLFDLMPKKPFKRVGEQIDGAFIHQHTHFLLEAKWRAKPADLNDLRDLDGAVRTSLDNTLGLFISMNGYTQVALNAYIIGDRPKLICMDGEDLIYVLGGQIGLTELLSRKIDCAVNKRLIHAPASKILAGHYWPAKLLSDERLITVSLPLTSKGLQATRAKMMRAKHIQ